VGITIQTKDLSEIMSASGLATRSTIKYKDFLKLFLGKLVFPFCDFSFY
jgi:hypothetical protein